MAKSELGTKRVCPVTGRKFYDLNKNPVISPYTGEVVPIVPLATRGGRVEKAIQNEAEQETEEVEGAEFVSLEEADAESKGSKTGKTDVPDTGDDIDVDVDDDGDDDDDSTFIEDDEESDDDVTDIIGDGLEKDEES